jgi:hypothetical protein
VAPPALVPAEVTGGGNPKISWTSNPRITSDRVLTLDGTVTNNDSISPSMIQVWQIHHETTTLDCPMERPVAFIRPGNNSGTVYSRQSSSYGWHYCGVGKPIVDQVPWLATGNWSYTQRKRRYTTEPFIWDFQVTVDLKDERVQALEFPDWTAWRVVVYSGEDLLTWDWVSKE